MKNIIGIIGGMGPQAGIELCNQLIAVSTRDFGAKNGGDFPEIILDSLPIPDFISSTKNRVVARKMLKICINKFNNLQIDQIGIACNTAHMFLPELQDVSNTPIVSMIEAVCDALADDMKSVGILASPTTIRFGIYHSALEKRGKIVITPTLKQQIILEKIIRNVIAGKLLMSDTCRLHKIASSLRKRGAQGIILGCTELPLVFPQKFSLPVFNSLKILAKALLCNNYK